MDHSQRATLDGIHRDLHGVRIRVIRFGLAPRSSHRYVLVPYGLLSIRAEILGTKPSRFVISSFQTHPRAMPAFLPMPYPPMDTIPGSHSFTIVTKAHN